MLFYSRNDVLGSCKCHSQLASSLLSLSPDAGVPFVSFGTFFRNVLQCAREMSPPKMTGFKPCKDFCKQMSVTDSHQACLLYLWLSHDSKACSDCTSMNPKAIQDKSVHGQASDDSTS